MWVSGHLRRLVLPVLLVGALGFAAVGCGDDDNEKSDKASTTKTEQAAVPAESKVPPYAGDPKATKQPDEQALAKLPSVTPADKAKLKPSIKGLEGLSVPEYIDAVSKDVGTFWQQVFNNSGFEFPEVQQVIVDQQPVESKCGVTVQRDSGTGYCPEDPALYFPVGIYEQLTQQIGDAAAAVIIAQVWGIRVQDLLGQFQQTQDQNLLAKQSACFAGVWMSTVQERQALEEGDIEEALGAEGAVNFSGDQNANPQNQIDGFNAGFQSADPNACALDKLQNGGGGGGETTTTPTETAPTPTETTTP